jgi:hypothetical protein
VADQKLTALTAITPALVDQFYVVDTDDSTDDPAGSSRSCTLSNLLIGGGVPRKLFDHFADASSSSTNGTFDTLYTDSIPANTFANNGDTIEARYCMTFVSSATATRDVKISFAAQTIMDTGALTFSSAGTADVWVTIIRESSSVVRVAAEFIPSGITQQPIVTYTRLTGLTVINLAVLALTAAAAGAGAAASDITAKMGCIFYMPAVPTTT